MGARSSALPRKGKKKTALRGKLGPASGGAIPAELPFSGHRLKELAGEGLSPTGGGREAFFDKPFFTKPVRQLPLARSPAHYQGQMHPAFGFQTKTTAPADAPLGDLHLKQTGRERPPPPAGGRTGFFNNLFFGPLDTEWPSARRPENYAVPRPEESPKAALG